MTYFFEYKKSWWLFWKKRKIKGHGYVEKTGHMDLFFEDGTINSIAQWSKYDLKLGTDWVLTRLDEMKKQAGQEIVTNIKMANLQ